MADVMQNQDPIKSSADSSNQKNDDTVEDDADIGPPTLQEYASQSYSSQNDQSDVDANEVQGDMEKNPENGAPVLSVIVSPKADPQNALRSPPKLIPAVAVSKRPSDESNKTFKPLTGSMRNTSASLSIIEAPSSNPTKSTRSTRSSIDPTFAAKQRSFLNKVHNALSSVPHDDTSCESDQEVAPDEEDASDRSPEYIPGCEGIPRRPMSLFSTNYKRRRDDSLAGKGKLSSVVAPEQSSNSSLSEEKGTSEPSPPKKRFIVKENGEERLSDMYCWICHREDASIACATCPRAYHNHCLRRSTANNPEAEWVCMECVNIIKAESQETRSKALKMRSLDQLCNLLLSAVERMKYCINAEVFEGPVDPVQFPSYADHIVNPMYLSLLEKNIKKKMYGSTEAFVADASWIVHNCIIFNSFNSKLTSVAKNILRVCKQEMAEIENCPDCYNYAYSADENWFIQVCQKPHVLVWAKLKGFPYWPAKAMRYQSDTIDVRFFGAHDRAWVPARDCYMYSQENPNPNAPNKIQPPHPQQRKRNPRNNLDTCIEEVEAHIQLLKERFSVFKYAPPKTAINRKNLDGHLKFMLPEYKMKDHGTATPPKVPLQKRASFELKSTASGPSVKRMKTDGSSPNQSNIVKVMKPASVKESAAPSLIPCDPAPVIEDDSPAIKGSDELAQKNVVTHVEKTIIDVVERTKRLSAISKENGVFVLKKNVDCPETKSKSPAVSVTPQTVMPEQRQTLTTPLTSPEVTSIAERVLKKKDARKGLVDRLQEKLSRWVALPPSSSGAEENNVGPQLSNQEKTEENLEKDGNGEAQRSYIEVCPGDKQITVECEVETKSSLDVGEVKRDLFGSAKAVCKESVDQILHNFNINKNQPKVVLKKLVLGPPEKDPSPTVQVSKQSMQTADNFSCTGQEQTLDKSNQLASNVKKIKVTGMKLVSEGEEIDRTEKTAEESADKLKSVPTKATMETLNSEAPAACSTPNASHIRSVFIKNVLPGPAFPKFRRCSSEKSSPQKAASKSNLQPASKPLVNASKAQVQISNKEDKLSEESPEAVTDVEPIVETKEEPASDVEMEESDGEQQENEIHRSKSLESPSFRSSVNEENSFDNSETSVEIKEDSSIKKTVSVKLSKSEIKIVKPFTIRARPLSELKDSSALTPILVKPACESDKSSHMSASPSENDSDNKGNNSENIVALKSLLAKNVTVRLETSGRKDKQLPPEGEKLLIIPSSSESNGATPPRPVPIAANSKVVAVVTQSGNAVKKVESPIKSPTSPTLFVSSTQQRLSHGATSILRVNKSLSPVDGKISVSTASREESARPPAHRIIIASNLSVSKPQISNAPSTVKIASGKTPTYVVSQDHVSLSSRRILPKAIPLLPSSTTTTISGGASNQITSKPASTTCLTSQSIFNPVSAPANLDNHSKVVPSKSSLRSLLSAPEGSSKKAVSIFNRLPSLELEGIVKIPSPRITVSPLYPSSTSESPAKSIVIPSSRTMPSLSLASVCSSANSSTIEAKSGQSAMQPPTNALTQAVISTTSEMVPKLALGKGPVSSELRSQANKMTEVFMGCLEDCLGEMSGMGNLEAQIRVLQLEMERMQWRHQQEIDELRHNTELIISEIRDRMKVESQHSLSKALALAKKEKEAAILAAKEKQWCAFCKKEAMFYCCWNTSYCDYRCQQSHWPTHSLTCTQNSASVDPDHHLTVENGHAKPASLRRMVIRSNKVTSPPLLKKH